MQHGTMRNGDTMASIDVREVDGRYQGAVRITRADSSSYTHFYRIADTLCDSPETAFEHGKKLAITILRGL